MSIDSPVIAARVRFLCCRVSDACPHGLVRQLCSGRAGGAGVFACSLAYTTSCSACTSESCGIRTARKEPLRSSWRPHHARREASVFGQEGGVEGEGNRGRERKGETVREMAGARGARRRAACRRPSCGGAHCGQKWRAVTQPKSRRQPQHLYVLSPCIMNVYCATRTRG